jgi:large subunit ribosomal protein L25
MAAHTRPRLNASSRQAGRKSDLHNLRRNGVIPASLFGHGDPENIQVESKDLSEHLRHHAQGGLLELVLEGKATPALLRELDRNPVTGQVVTLGFQRVNLQETVKASLPIEIVGEDALVAEGLVLNRDLDHLEVHGRADALPESLVLDVSGFGAGHTVRIRDLTLPKGIETSKDPELPVLSVATPHLSADVAAALDAEDAAHDAEKVAHAEEAGEAAAEPEAAAE